MKKWLLGIGSLASMAVAVIPTVSCLSSEEKKKAKEAGATAVCNDDTYSYSEHAQGTCSHHGVLRVE